MGVHLTFVRSVDLDEWTQSQIDSMRLGGNGSARTYMRQHGCTDLSGPKKYKSKAAKSYRVELDKLIKAEGRKRGEGAVGDAAAAAAGGSESNSSQSLLDNLKVADLKSQQNEAKEKLAAARNSNGSSSSGILTPKARLASSMPGASKLIIKKPSGTLGGLRKPTTSSNLLKKPMKKSSKLRVNKLSMKLTTPGTADEGFEDVGETQKQVKEAEEQDKQLKKDREEQLKNDEELAMAVQVQLK
jgi:ADP-ribosylation factor GTPase-activating protein 2/3